MAVTVSKDIFYTVYDIYQREWYTLITQLAAQGNRMGCQVCIRACSRSAIPPLPQPLPPDHRLRDYNRKREPTDREDQLQLVKVFAQNIKRARRREPRREQVEPKCEDE